MSSTLDLLRNANRLVLEQLDAAEEKLRAKEMEARQMLDDCVSRRDIIQRKRELIQEVERLQLESLAEVADAESVSEAQPLRVGAATGASVRIGDRLALAVVRASQNAAFAKR